MSNELKPCPICGSDNIVGWIFSPHSKHSDKRLSLCDDCGFACSAITWNNLPRRDDTTIPLDEPSCGGPQEACMEPGCQECGAMPTIPPEALALLPCEFNECRVVNGWTESASDPTMEVKTIAFYRPKAPAWKVGDKFKELSGFEWMILRHQTKGFSVVCLTDASQGDFFTSIDGIIASFGKIERVEKLT